MTIKSKTSTHPSGLPVWSRDGTSGKSCGTDQKRLPGAPSDTSEGPGRPRDGTSGKTCGTDQRRLPGAPSDTSEGPGRPALGRNPEQILRDGSKATSGRPFCYK